MVCSSRLFQRQRSNEASCPKKEENSGQGKPECLTRNGRWKHLDASFKRFPWLFEDTLRPVIVCPHWSPKLVWFWWDLDTVENSPMVDSPFAETGKNSHQFGLVLSTEHDSLCVRDVQSPRLWGASGREAHLSGSVEFTSVPLHCAWKRGSQTHFTLCGLWLFFTQGLTLKAQEEKLTKASEPLVTSSQFRENCPEGSYSWEFAGCFFLLAVFLLGLGMFHIFSTSLILHWPKEQNNRDHKKPAQGSSFRLRSPRTSSHLGPWACFWWSLMKKQWKEQTLLPMLFSTVEERSSYVRSMKTTHQRTQLHLNHCWMWQSLVFGAGG